MKTIRLGVVRIFRIATSLVNTHQFFSDQAVKASRVIMPLPPRKARAYGNTVKTPPDNLGGKGGDGALSFSSIWCKQWNGPDGGEGGNGGHVIFVADRSTRALNHLPYRIQGPNGTNGMSRNCYGANAKPLYVKVPVGTIFRKYFTGDIVSELKEEGELFIAARGGAGGHGNKFFLSNEHRAPAYAEEGAKGEAILYAVELRIMAQVGLVGFPNAGKSTFLRAISRARPKVAAYPFTTLQPHIGIVEYEDYVQLAVADIPGLLPGAAHDKVGLGVDFLRHIERCACLAYVVDLSLGDEPWEQIEALNYELEQYQVGLSKRPSMIVANKIDLPANAERVKMLKERSSLSVYPVSAKYRDGVLEFLVAVRQLCDELGVYSAAAPDENC